MIDRTPLVRPAFARWSIVAFVLLLPFVAYSVWDYVEARRLRTRLDAIVARGEPIGRGLVLPKGPAADADRYYRAASALAGDYTADIPPVLAHDIQMAEAGGQWTSALVAAMRAIVHEHEDALALIDRAAPLPFEGFRTGLQSGSLGGLMGAQRLCEFRTRVLALGGDGEGAAQSMWSDIRLMRTTMFAARRLSVVTLLLDRGHPSSAARAKLATALADLDHADAFRRQLIEQRTFMIERRQNVGGFFGTLVIHQLNSALDTYAQLIEAAGRPEAERHAAIMAVGRLPMSALPLDLASAERSRALLESILAGTERKVEMIHCARRQLQGEVVNCRF
jgi:hypothetical protein